jgi:hypothetical protein
MVEQVHRQLKDALRARVAGYDWPTTFLGLLGVACCPEGGFHHLIGRTGLWLAPHISGRVHHHSGAVAAEVCGHPADCPSSSVNRAKILCSGCSCFCSQSPSGKICIYLLRRHSATFAASLRRPYRVLTSGEKCFLIDMGRPLEASLRPSSGITSDAALRTSLEGGHVGA